MIYYQYVGYVYFIHLELNQKIIDSSFTRNVKLVFVFVFWSHFILGVLN